MKFRADEINRFAEVLSLHHVPMGDKGGHVAAVSRHLGISVDRGEAILLRIKERLGVTD